LDSALRHAFLHARADQFSSVHCLLPVLLHCRVRCAALDTFPHLCLPGSCRSPLHSALGYAHLPGFVGSRACLRWLMLRIPIRTHCSSTFFSFTCCPAPRRTACWTLRDPTSVTTQLLPLHRVPPHTPHTLRYRSTTCSATPAPPLPPRTAGRSRSGLRAAHPFRLYFAVPSHYGSCFYILPLVRLFYLYYRIPFAATATTRTPFLRLFTGLRCTPLTAACTPTACAHCGLLLLARISRCYTRTRACSTRAGSSADLALRTTTPGSSAWRAALRCTYTWTWFTRG